MLNYRANAEIGGKLASVGSRLVQTVAGKNADDFFTAFARRLGGLSVEEAASQPVGATPVATRLPIPQGQASQSPAQSVSPGGLTALVPAWLVVFASLISFALGYFVAR